MNSPLFWASGLLKRGIRLLNVTWAFGPPDRNETPACLSFRSRSSRRRNLFLAQAKADFWFGAPYYCGSMRLTKARVTAPAISGPAEFTSPYQQSFLPSSQGGWLSHSALGMM